MNDYTPTDEQVREEYMENRIFISSNIALDRGAAYAEFDRWLEAHDREVGAGTLTGVAQAYFANGGTQTAAELLEIAKRIQAGEGG